MTLSQPPISSASPAASLPNLGRVAGAGWFFLLAALNGRNLVEAVIDLPPPPLAFEQWAPILSSGCILAFFLTLTWLMLVRPTATAQRTEWLPRTVSLLGTYGVWTVSFLPSASLSPTLAMASAAATLVGSVLIVYTIIHLGRSFSIAPQARTLITQGPYSLVRHPLYAAEEIATVGVAMHIVWWGAIPFVLVHLGLQIWRMKYEERLLASVFPEYAAYAGRTARLIPGVW